MDRKKENERRFETIATAALAARLARGERFEFWNVLTAEYYSGENIVGSRHVALDRIGQETARAGLPKETEIVVYCAGPECPQSRAAAEKLAAYGYANVKVYEGGLEEWEAAGLPLVDEKTAAVAGADGVSCH